MSLLEKYRFGLRKNPLMVHRLTVIKQRGIFHRTWEEVYKEAWLLLDASYERGEPSVLIKQMDYTLLPALTRSAWTFDLSKHAPTVRTILNMRFRRSISSFWKNDQILEALKLLSPGQRISYQEIEWKDYDPALSCKKGDAGFATLEKMMNLSAS